MTKIRSEFFALPDEALAWAVDWAETYTFVIALDDAPMSGQWRILDQPSELAIAGSVRAIALIKKPTTKRHLQDALFLEAGRLHENSLKPSLIGGETDNPTLLGQWRKVVSDLKKKTGVGLWLVDPGTGERAISKKMRCSPKVGQLSRHGLVLRAFAGWNVYEVSEVAGV